MKKVYQFFIAICLVFSFLFISSVAMAKEFSREEFENQVRLYLKKGAVVSIIKLDFELSADQATNDLEDLLASQEQEELLIALLEEERSCNDDEMLKLYFREAYSHCK